MMFFRRKVKSPKSVVSGWLPSDDGHQIYYHTYGNPAGAPVLCFHGGPGGSSKAKHAMRFNLKKYYVILFDQRGCGKSKYTDLLYKNTPADAVADGMRLLEYLGINGPVIINGGSYGSLVALLFAQKYPKIVSKIWVASIFLGRHRDVQDWQEHDAMRFYPDFITKLQKMAGKKSISEYFASLLFSGQPSQERCALQYYGSLEGIVGALEPSFSLPDDADYADELRSLKIMANMTVNNFFMQDNQIIKNASKIKHIPTVIVHNRLDMCCPFEQAWQLHNALPVSELIVVSSHGHGSDKMNEVLKQLYG